MTSDLALLTYFENNRLVVSLQEECENVCIHECLPALAQDVDGFLEELDFYPRHVQRLHLLHFPLDSGVKLSWKKQKF